MTTSTRTVWIARACPGGWLPWEHWEGWPGPFRAAAAHRVARSLRFWGPADLVAVRPDGAGEPLWPEAMVDHYDLPPYADPD